MIAHQTGTDKILPLLPHLQNLLAFVQKAAEDGTPVHDVELGIWNLILVIGREALGHFFDLQGDGDLGPSLTLPDGHTVRRLPERHPRTYRSVFGTFKLQRTVYGTREGQKIECVPLDARLQLPAGDFSYLLQKWDQLLGVEQAFGRVAQTLHEVLGLEQSVDSLEQMNREMAGHVTEYRDTRPAPPPAEEGEVMVLQADGKGIVMRRDAEHPAIVGHRKKGEKASQKRMSIVGTVYSIGRHKRTAQDIIDSLFRDPKEAKPKGPPRPQPCHKRLWAYLSHQDGDEEVNGMAQVFGRLEEELSRRNPLGCRETVTLMDGQKALWDVKEALVPSTEKDVSVLDLLHVTPRLWDAAHLFCKENSDAAVVYVKQSLVGVLAGKVEAVVRGMRRRAKKEGMSASKQARLRVVCRYLLKNKERMRYNVYLERGYPIASGVIEGACRHYVKDRMERAGMHWVYEGAQAMLDVRGVYLEGDWEKYQQFRIARETERLYPYRQMIEATEWVLAV